jgi:hypothetical protein
MNAIALLTLIIVSFGCAARQAAPRGITPGTRVLSEEERQHALRAYVATLPPGGRVRVTLAGGDRFPAIILNVAGDDLLLQPRGRLPEAQRAVPLAEVLALEPDTGSSSIAKAAVIGVATGAATFLGLLIVTYLVISD